MQQQQRRRQVAKMNNLLRDALQCELCLVLPPNDEDSDSAVSSPCPWPRYVGHTELRGDVSDDDQREYFVDC